MHDGGRAVGWKRCWGSNRKDIKVIDLIGISQPAIFNEDG